MTGKAPLRVAIVSAGELYGGVERFISTFSAHLKGGARGSATVFLFFDGALARELRAQGIDVAVAPYSGKFDPRQAFWLAREMRARKCDVVHAHGYKAGVVAGLAAAISGLPAVKTEHGALEPFSGLADLKMRLYLALDRWLTETRFEEVVYITSDLLEKRLWSGRRGSRVIANGITAVADTARPPAQAPFDGDRFHVGIVGRLSPVKGHSVLFDAVAASSHRERIRVHVLGDGPLSAELAARTRSLGIDVVFHGFRSDIAGLMARLDCLAMPSFHEGLPYTLLEAMHLGLPIVASAVGGMKEILVNDGSALLSAPGNAKEFGANLDRLVADAALGRRLGAEARREAREHFDISRMADAYLSLYADVVAA